MRKKVAKKDQQLEGVMVRLTAAEARLLDRLRGRTPRAAYFREAGLTRARLEQLGGTLQLPASTPQAIKDLAQWVGPWKVFISDDFYKAMTKAENEKEELLKGEDVAAAAGF